MHTLYFMELMDMGRLNRMWKASFPRQRALSCMSGEREPSIHTLMNELCLHHKYSVTSCCLKHPLPLLSHSESYTVGCVTWYCKLKSTHPPLSYFCQGVLEQEKCGTTPPGASGTPKRQREDCRLSRAGALLGKALRRPWRK